MHLHKFCAADTMSEAWLVTTRTAGAEQCQCRAQLQHTQVSSRHQQYFAKVGNGSVEANDGLAVVSSIQDLRDSIVVRSTCQTMALSVSPKYHPNRTTRRSTNLHQQHQATPPSPSKPSAPNSSAAKPTPPPPVPPAAPPKPTTPTTPLCTSSRSS